MEELFNELELDPEAWKIEFENMFEERLIEVASTQDCILAYEPKHSNRVWFIYNTGVILFHFHLLCEVGGWYVDTFKSLLEGYGLISTETENDYFEILLKI